MSNKIKDPGAGKVAFKAVVAAIAGFIILYCLIGFIAMMAEGFDAPDKADIVSWCEDSYAAREFDDLQDRLVLYDLYGEDYDQYWEAVEGYELRCRYIQWSMAAQQDIDGAEEAAADCLARLQSMAENPRHDRNDRLLKGFWEDVTKDRAPSN